LRVATWSIAGSPRRHDRCTRRSSLGEILRACGLPRDGDGISAREWTKWVWLFDVAQEGAPARTSALARTALTGARDRPRLPEFRRLSNTLAEPFKIVDGQVTLWPVCARKNLPVGCHPDRGAASPRSGKTLEAQYRCQDWLSGSYQAS
jgi:hypothetical protein